MARIKRQAELASSKSTRRHANAGKSQKKSAQSAGHPPPRKKQASKSINNNGAVEKLKPLIEATKFLMWLEKQLPETEAGNNHGQQECATFSGNRRLSWVVGLYFDSLPAQDGIGKQSRAGRAVAVRSLTAVIRKGLKEIET
jgi:hypothetical protein